MRNQILNFLRVHPAILNCFWKVAHIVFAIVSIFIPVREKTMLITSFAGRKYDDSPKALFERIRELPEFRDWEIIWAFVDPSQFDIPGIKKVRIDTWAFFAALMYSKVWISNSGMDRNIGIRRKGIVKVETWHGTPLKKIGSEQNSGTLGNYKPSKKVDNKTIRCAQSEFDKTIFARVFNASEGSFLMCDLPRNDELLSASAIRIKRIREKLHIPEGKKVLLYMPTYREYLINEDNQTFLAPPMNLDKWKEKIGNHYVLLMRAHYAVSEALKLVENEFVRDVSKYPFINDLYFIADILISDYSSSFFDFSILKRPMLCFAYDLDEYSKKRGLYLDMNKELPCPIDQTEDEVLDHILNIDYEKASEKAAEFNSKYAPYAGHSSQTVINEVIKRLQL